MNARPLVIPFAAPRILQAQGPAQRLISDHAPRIAHYQELRDFYEGRHTAVVRRGHRSLVANYARAIVDKHVAFGFARGVLLVGEDEEGRRGPIDTALADLTREVGLPRTLLQAATNASVLGDAVLKVVWAPETASPHPALGLRPGGRPLPGGEARGADSLALPHRGGGEERGASPSNSLSPWERVGVRAGRPSSSGTLRVLSLDPGRFFPTFAADDPTQLRAVAVTSTLSPEEARERYGLHLARPAELLESWTADSLTLSVGSETVWSGLNPYGLIPFIHVPNLAPPSSCYGLSELEDVIPLNRELDERLSDQADVIRYHADPPVIFRGVREHSDLAVGPGTVWDIPDTADVSLLEWRGQAPAVQQHLEQVLRAMYDVAETPRSSFGDTEQAFSGVALETQLQPIIQRTLRRRIVWDAALQQLGRELLMLAEQFGWHGAAPGDFAPYAVRVRWLPMLPRDDDAEANRYIALTAAGLHAHSTAMEALGIPDPEAELARIRTERISPDVSRPLGGEGSS